MQAGARVKIVAGFYAGRVGVVTDSQERVGQSFVWVTLDPQNQGDEPLPVTVLASEVQEV